MSDTLNWLTRFEQCHAELRNPLVYWAALPMVISGLVGLLWSLPIPEQFVEISPLLNWGSAFLMAAAIYYFIISLPLAVGMLPFLLGLATIQIWLSNSGLPAMGVATGLMIAGTVGLALGRGHQIGKLILDLQLIMIGPLWLLSMIYKRVGIPL